MKNIFIGIGVLLASTRSTDPFDSFEVFEGLELDEPMEIEDPGNPEVTDIPKPTEIPPPSPSTVAPNDDNIPNPDDWCYEYDEARFKLDATRVAITTADQHDLFLRKLIINTLDYVNSRILNPGMPHLRLDQVAQLANATTLPDHSMAPVRRMNMVLEHPFGHSKESIAKLFRDILYQEPNMFNFHKAVLLARVMVGLGLLRKKNALSRLAHVRIRYELLKKIYDNEDSIRVGFERRAAAAEELLVGLRRRRELEDHVTDKFDKVREVIREAIEKYSVSSSAAFPTSAELRSACLESARSVMFNRLLVHDSLRKLPNQLKKDLKQKNWNFLTKWIEALDHLRGVGPYTKGAILGFAFKQRALAMDGNVMRVLSRVYCIEDEISQAKNQQQFWQIATRLVKGIRPGDFNQSLMELGAMICTPKSPTCLLCPLKDECQAFQNQKVHILPKKASKAKIEDFHYVALVVKDQNQVLVGLRPHQGLLGGMWCLPMFESDLILNALPKEQLLKHGQIQHAFTHKRWVLDLYEIPKTALQDEQLILNSDQNQRMKWGYFDEQTLDTMAISGPSLKALLKAKMKLTKRRGAGH